ncbi:hypothetical protein GDO81_017053 [Engystomops pustulosus]|uniref:Uncharacterized protein n=1 Tax=Engystomops pustulosus TaxID=76066 RepID=A0AAV7ABB9_ENGPU|nr:hypothetical protein GDO81_017053 [Engystomops pustulosus]
MTHAILNFPKPITNNTLQKFSTIKIIAIRCDYLGTSTIWSCVLCIRPSNITPGHLYTAVLGPPADFMALCCRNTKFCVPSPKCEMVNPLPAG